MKNKEMVYSEFNSYLFCKLLETRQNVIRAKRSKFSSPLMEVIISNNEILEEIWEEWEKEAYEK